MKNGNRNCVRSNPRQYWLAFDFILFFDIFFNNFFSLKESVLRYVPETVSPFSTTVMLIGYLYCVLKQGPKFMKNRKAFNLRSVILVYNFLQIIANTMLVVTVTISKVLDSKEELTDETILCSTFHREDSWCGMPKTVTFA